ncbi:hypothetical protein PoB_003117400 [Plakobranchus ocellatus]|uniref:Uncharacterized protein n=1 Tax=Plakobranchus ocellatus TaxID=259542 RepID=A0AAV4AAI2_9GAST|nr:hypothetical protein PoB_003117400 [Plakobranchus ocellatus]
MHCLRIGIYLLTGVISIACEGQKYQKYGKEKNKKDDTREMIKKTEKSSEEFDGSVQDFPVVRIRAETPFIRGVLEALEVEDPIADLIIGNCGDISDSPLKVWLNDSNSGNSTEQHRHVNRL